MFKVLSEKLHSVEIREDGQIEAQWARRFINEHGAEEVGWHRCAYSATDILPDDALQFIEDGKATVHTPAKHPAAAVLEN